MMNQSTTQPENQQDIYNMDSMQRNLPGYLGGQSPGPQPDTLQQQQQQRFPATASTSALVYQLHQISQFAGQTAASQYSNQGYVGYPQVQGNVYYPQQGQSNYPTHMNSPQQHHQGSVGMGQVPYGQQWLGPSPQQIPNSYYYGPQHGPQSQGNLPTQGTNRSPAGSFQSYGRRQSGLPGSLPSFNSSGFGSSQSGDFGPASPAYNYGPSPIRASNYSGTSRRFCHISFN
jgi:hypothetical protein